MRQPLNSEVWCSLSPLAGAHMRVATAKIAGVGVIRSSGGNIGPALGCPLNQTSDVVAVSLAQIGLGPLLRYADGSSALVPNPGSMVLDRINCTVAGFDQRGQPSPVDGNGDGIARCDVGAIERQLVEISDTIFADGFENL